MLGHQRKFAETTGVSGRVAPKRPAGLPVSPVTSAEELRHVPASVLPSEAEVEAHNVSHLPWSHPVQSKGGVHPYPARALMADLDFMGYKRVILKSDQEPSIVAFCDAVKNG